MKDSPGGKIERITNDMDRAVFLAMRYISSNLHNFSIHTKDPDSNNALTEIGIGSQKILVDYFQQHYPQIGILTKEATRSIRGSGEEDWRFIIDLFGGTESFIKGFDHGVSVMVSLVDFANTDNGILVSSFIGDIHTKEVYSARYTYRYPLVQGPNQDLVLLSKSKQMTLEFNRLLIRGSLGENYDRASRELVATFKHHKAINGSIGSWCLNLVRQEVSALLVGPLYEYPWNLAACKHLLLQSGFIFMKHIKERDSWEPCDLPITLTGWKRDFDLLIIRSELGEQLINV